MINKKVIIFIGDLRSGGAERVVSIISKGFLQEFKEIEIILYYDRPIFYNLDKNIKIRIIERETKSRNILKNILWLRKNVNKENIFLSFLAPFNIVAIVALFFKKKIIVADRNDPRSDPPNFIKRFIRDILYNFTEKVVCQTESNKKYFNKNIQEKTSIIYNPIYLSEKIGSTLEEKKENRIVSVGRLSKQKNQILLIDSFKRVLKYFPDYKLIIYGEGEERINLENYIKKLDLEKNISLPGAFKDVHTKIKGAKAFIMTSDYEGMPNALLEAMSLGLPCISTKVSGAIDLIENYKNGVLVNRNSDEISNEIMKILKNENYAHSLGKEASKLYYKLNEKEIVNQWVDLLKN